MTMTDSLATFPALKAASSHIGRVYTPHLLRKRCSLSWLLPSEPARVHPETYQEGWGLKLPGKPWAVVHWYEGTDLHKHMLMDVYWGFSLLPCLKWLNQYRFFDRDTVDSNISLNKIIRRVQFLYLIKAFLAQYLLHSIPWRNWITTLKQKAVSKEVNTSLGLLFLFSTV